MIPPIKPEPVLTASLYRQSDWRHGAIRDGKRYNPPVPGTISATPNRRNPASARRRQRVRHLKGTNTTKRRRKAQYAVPGSHHRRHETPVKRMRVCASALFLQLRSPACDALPRRLIRRRFTTAIQLLRRLSARRGRSRAVHREKPATSPDHFDIAATITKSRFRHLFRGDGIAATAPRSRAFDFYPPAAFSLLFQWLQPP